VEESGRTDLVQRALTALKAEQLSPPVRKAIERDGLAHRQVIALANKPSSDLQNQSLFHWVCPMENSIG
jgi:hypothetical protein